MTAPHTDSASYEIGHGKPPRHTQFQKGRSGNPGGRPRRSPAERLSALVLHEAYRTMIVMEDGRAVPLPAIQAVVRGQLQIAAAGNVRAQRAILTMVRDIERADAIKAQVAATYGPVSGTDADDDDIADVDEDNADDGNADSMQQADAIDACGKARQEEQEEPQDLAAATPPTGSEPSLADGALPPEDAAAPPAGPQLQRPKSGRKESARNDARDERGKGSAGERAGARVSWRHNVSPDGAIATGRQPARRSTPMQSGRTFGAGRQPRGRRCDHSIRDARVPGHVPAPLAQERKN